MLQQVRTLATKTENNLSSKLRLKGETPFPKDVCSVPHRETLKVNKPTRRYMSYEVSIAPDVTVIR